MGRGTPAKRGRRRLGFHWPRGTVAGRGRPSFQPLSPPRGRSQNPPGVRREERTPMVDYNLINSLGDIDAEVDAAVATALGDAVSTDGGGTMTLDLTKLVSGDEVQDFTPGAIIKGRISSTIGDDFVVEL